MPAEVSDAVRAALSRLAAQIEVAEEEAGAATAEAAESLSRAVAGLVAAGEGLGARGASAESGAPRGEAVVSALRRVALCLQFEDRLSQRLRLVAGELRRLSEISLEEAAGAADFLWQGQDGVTALYTEAQRRRILSGSAPRAQGVGSEVRAGDVELF